MSLIQEELARARMRELDREIEAVRLSRQAAALRRRRRARRAVDRRRLLAIRLAVR